MKILIIQSSPKGTASTVLVNILYGLIPELANTPIIYRDLTGTPKFNYEENENIKVIKTHNLNIDRFITLYSKIYQLYFICSERPQLDKRINNKYKLSKYTNIIIFSFDELNETQSNSISNIVNTVYNKINPILNIHLDIDSSINRLILMNKKYEEIKEKSFDYSDGFFKIHGSHRNRQYE